MDEGPTLQSFAYEAQSPSGDALSGTIDAPDAETAQARLTALHLRVIQIAPADARIRPRALRGEDFLAFNQQLAHLTQAGLPMEQSLRLIAQDMRSGRLSATVNQIADELEKGTPLPAAFEAHRGRFPPLYGRLIDAGAKSGRLSAMLFALGRHLELVGRMRTMLWQSLAYPLVTVVLVIVLLIVMGIFILPQFEELYEDFGTTLPMLTRFLLGAARATPAGIVVLGVLVLALVLLWQVLRHQGKTQAVVEWIVAPVPLLGRVLRWSLVARWCDALKLGVESGLDLPAALRLAGDSTGSPGLRQDSQRLSEALERGQSLARAPTRMLPASVPAAVALASERYELAPLLDSLARTYERHAELRMGALNALLMPLLLLVIGGVLFFITGALFLPLVKLITSLTG